MINKKLKFRKIMYVPNSIEVRELSDFIRDNVNGSPLIVHLKDAYGFGYLSVERKKHNGSRLIRELELPQNFSYEEIRDSGLYDDIFYNAHKGIYLNVKRMRNNYRVRVYN